VKLQDGPATGGTSEIDGGTEGTGIAMHPVSASNTIEIEK
jgi:hypothetical protein